jgi:hypothetical protein
MNIAIDLDGTADTHVEMFAAIVKIIELHGWTVYLVSSRQQVDRYIVKDWAKKLGIDPHRAICTGGIAKKFFCQVILGLTINQWWDDDPSSIINGK